MRLLPTGTTLLVALTAAYPLLGEDLSGRAGLVRSSFELGAVRPTLAEASPSDMPVGEVAVEPSVPYPPHAEASTWSTGPALTEYRYTDCGPVGWSLADELCGRCRPFDIGGWTQFGYHSGVIPLSEEENDFGSFEDVPHEVQLNQQWFYAGRDAHSDGKWSDWGFRLDVVYGTDAQKMQAFGNPGGEIPNRGRWDASLDHGKYGWAIPQAYVEYAYNGWEVIAGHFLSPLGYETLPSVGNFFYSRSLTRYNSEPFTHTGVLTSYSGFDGIKVYAGWTAGWDSGFDSLNSGSNYLGGVALDLTDDVTLTYLATAGNFGWLGDAGGAYSHSIVLTALLSPRWEYVLQTDFVDIDGVENGDLEQYDTIGINQYLFYTLSKQWKAGARAEWWKADGDSFYEVTYGLNYLPHPNVVVRPEMRHDWSPVEDYTENTFSVDVIFAY